MAAAAQTTLVKTSATTPRNLGSELLRSIDAEIAKFEGPEAVAHEVTNGCFSGMPDYIFNGVCLSDIARTLGMSLGGVSRIFNGDRRIRKYVLKSIAATYTDGDEAVVRRIIRSRTLRRLSLNRNMDIAKRNRLLANVALEAADIGRIEEAS